MICCDKCKADVDNQSAAGTSVKITFGPIDNRSAWQVGFCETRHFCDKCYEKMEELVRSTLNKFLETDK